MLRLTTNVTVSPASSARSSSAAWRMSSTASGRVSANSAVSSSGVSSTPSRPFATAPATRSRRIGCGASVRPEPLRGMNDQKRVLMTSSTPWSTQSASMYFAYTQSRSVSATPSSSSRLRTWCGDGNGCSGEMWSPLDDRPPRSVAPACDELRPPVREVRRDLDADVGHEPPRLADEALHVLDRDRRRPLRSLGVRRERQPRLPVALGDVGRDVGRLLAVVPAVRDEVLEDDLLQVPVLGVHRGERLERRDAVLLGLADPHEDPRRERDPQLTRGADRRQAHLRVLRRGRLVRDEVVADRLEHHPLRRRHLAQPREVLPAERAEVRVRQDPAFQRPFARPHDVGDEVLEAELGELGPDPGVMVGLLAGEDEQLLHVATRCTVEEIDDLVRLVQMRAMGGERAVLAMRAAGPRQRQGDVAGEGDATTHR